MPYGIDEFFNDQPPDYPVDPNSGGDLPPPDEVTTPPADTVPPGNGTDQPPAEPVDPNATEPPPSTDTVPADTSGTEPPALAFDNGDGTFIDWNGNLVDANGDPVSSGTLPPVIVNSNSEPASGGEPAPNISEPSTEPVSGGTLPPVTAEDNWQHVYEEGAWTSTGPWSPDPSTVAIGTAFTQTRPTSRDITDYWTNSATGETRDDQSRTEFSSESQGATGTMQPDEPPATVLPPVKAEDNWQHVYTEGDWTPDGDWSPDPVTVAIGTNFVQKRPTSRTITDYWTNTATGETRDDRSHVEYSSEAQPATGTMHPIEPPGILPPVKAEDNWQHVYTEGDWIPNGDWAPDPATIAVGTNFVQTRPTTRQITDYWINTATGEMRENNSRTEFSSESQGATGELSTLPPVTAVDNWAHVYEEGAWIPAGNWSPDPATVATGTTFVQTRPTSRKITDYWTNSATGETRDDNSRTENSSESQPAIGTKAAAAKPADAGSGKGPGGGTTINPSPKHVQSTTVWYPTSEWLPLASSIPQGQPFEQSRGRQRMVIDYYLSSTGAISNDQSHLENGTETQAAIGTRTNATALPAPVDSGNSNWSWLLLLAAAVALSRRSAPSQKV